MTPPSPGQVFPTIRIVEAIVIAVLTSGMSMFTAWKVMEVEVRHLTERIDDASAALVVHAESAAHNEALIRFAEHELRLDRLEKIERRTAQGHP